MLGVVVIALMAAASATGAPERALATLQVNGTLITSREFSDAYCPPGTSGRPTCARYVGTGSILGLGRVTSTYTKVIRPGERDCEVLLLTPVVIDVAGKGTLELSRHGRTCWRLGSFQTMVGPFDFTVTGGSGTYAGTTGSVTFKTTVFLRDSRSSSDTWTGTLAVPGVDFDLTPPTIVSKAVRAPKRAKRVRVRYSVTAQDAVDGSVPVFCKPRSGSFFELGRTRVTCTATDTSGNSRRARFAVTVTRRRA